MIALGARRALRTATFTISAIPVVSQAAMNGVPLPVVVRLLGHSYVRMTMRYAHVGDREVEAAAKRAGQAIDTIMGQGGIHCSDDDGFANLSPPALADPTNTDGTGAWGGAWGLRVRLRMQSWSGVLRDFPAVTLPKQRFMPFGPPERVKITS